MPIKERNDRYKAEGRCPHCTKKHSCETVWCEICLEKRRIGKGNGVCIDCGGIVKRVRDGVRTAKRCTNCKRLHKNAYSRKYSMKDPEKRRKYYRDRARKFRHENRRAYQNRDIKHRYGVTLEHCEQLLFEQNGRCAICDISLPRLDAPKKLRKQVNIDHDHDTNVVRGILCPKCNMALGFFSDDPSLLTRALEYLNNTL